MPSLVNVSKLGLPIGFAGGASTTLPGLIVVLTLLRVSVSKSACVVCVQEPVAPENILRPCPGGTGFEPAVRLLKMELAAAAPPPPGVGVAAKTEFRPGCASCAAAAATVAHDT